MDIISFIKPPHQPAFPEGRGDPRSGINVSIKPACAHRKNSGTYFTDPSPWVILPDHWCNSAPWCKVVRRGCEQHQGYSFLKASQEVSNGASRAAYSWTWFRSSIQNETAAALERRTCLPLMCWNNRRVPSVVSISHVVAEGCQC